MIVSSIRLLSILIALSFGASEAHAYSGFVSDVRYGEHPYEARTRDLNRRQREQDSRKEFGYFVPTNDIYEHPAFARRQQLHPFFRKGGTAIGDSYATWRGYLGPESFHEMSPDTYCLNFRFMRLGYRAQPYGHECF